MEEHSKPTWIEGVSCPTGAAAKGGGRGGVGGGGIGGSGGAGSDGSEYRDAGTLGEDTGREEDEGCACSTTAAPTGSGILLTLGVLGWLA